MPRAHHSPETILDAARDVVVERGVRGATLEAIAEASRAPTGSIYYRFRSVDEVLARLWLRAVRRTQAVASGAACDDPVETVVAGALALYDFCLRDPDDARLVGSFRPSDFAHAEIDEGLRVELAKVNEPAMERLRELARALYGRADRATLDLVLLALVDLPHGLARRHLDYGTAPPAARRACLESAVRAVLADAHGRRA